MTTTKSTRPGALALADPIIEFLCGDGPRTAESSGAALDATRALIARCEAAERHAERMAEALRDAETSSTRALGCLRAEFPHDGPVLVMEADGWARGIQRGARAALSAYRAERGK